MTLTYTIFRFQRRLPGINFTCIDASYKTFYIQFISPKNLISVEESNTANIQQDSNNSVENLANLYKLI